MPTQTEQHFFFHFDLACVQPGKWPTQTETRNISGLSEREWFKENKKPESIKNV